MPRERKRHLQQELSFRTWGGKREGAGRPARKLAAGEKAPAPHASRDDLDHAVLHVTLRVLPVVKTLRTMDAYKAARLATRAVLGREYFRIVHLSLQDTHVHLVVEADTKIDLANGIRAFEISYAKRLNARMSRRGRVFADRYHARTLCTPTEVRNAIHYVLNNWHHHHQTHGYDTFVDPYSSGVSFHGWKELRDGAPEPPEPDFEPPLAVSPPRTWLARTGWRRGGEISMFSIPG